MRNIYLILFTFSFYFVFSQKTKVQGVVKDALTNEPIIGAIIVYGEGKGTTTDFDGNYTIALDSGTYVLKASYIGYKPVEKKVVAKGKTLFIDFSLSTNELSEVEVVSDIAVQRETPVAFSNIEAKKIQEELGSKDLPLILNSTPGVYATSQGGGDGDARISIRGFNSQNVMVLLDGIPMNGMTDGRVYWSNWFGLDNLTRGVQVQRGLGASKLAIPSIGGTMNILTAGIDSKKSLVVKNEYGNNNNYRIGLSYSSGRLKKGWAFSLAGSYKRNDGWFDQMYSKMWFYYGKVEKKIGAHLLSFSVLGAPQTSAQKDFRIPRSIAQYNKEYAYNLGIDTVGVREYGWRYNPGWNYLTRYEEGETSPKVFNSTINHFHKPVISLRDFITVSEKLNISTIFYASYGRGYGTTMEGGGSSNIDNITGQHNLQVIYDANSSPNAIRYYRDFYTKDTLDKGRLANPFIRKAHNDHNWYGTLITANYKINNEFNLSGGLDGRIFKGFQYSTVGDLLGGDVIRFSGNLNEDGNAFKRKGDIYRQNIEKNVRWAGTFAMLEYKKGKFAGFFNVSSSVSQYKQKNYFLKKILEIDGNRWEIGYFDSVRYNGVRYDRNSAELKVNETSWHQLVGFTVKTGGNFNINDNMNVFTNVGYLNRAPLIDNVFDSNNKLINGVKNENIKSIELGYSYHSSSFSANFNSYYTLWKNRPYNVTMTDQAGNSVPAAAIGMTARHMGIELDGIYKILKNLSVEGMASIADWEWISRATVTSFNDNGDIASTQNVDPRGVKVGDAAQITYAASVRYEPVKRLYIKPQFNFFGKNYANLNLGDYAESYTAAYTDSKNVYHKEIYSPNKNPERQSWRMPNYFLIDLNSGYSFTYWKLKTDIRLSVMNLLNTFYISDAQNNEYSSNFNAAAASVNVGMGRRWQASLVVTF